MPRPRATAAFWSGHRRRPRLPIHHRGRALDDLDAARVLEPAQAKLDRIEAGRRGQLVDEALDREAVGRLAGRAQRSGTQRRILEPMRDDLDGVGRIGRIAVLRDQAGVEAAHIVEAGGVRGQQRNVGHSPRRLRNPHLGAPVEDMAARHRPRPICRGAAEDPWDPSHARPRATIARAPGGRPRATGLRRRPRRPRGRSCHSSRSLRDRSAAPSLAASRGTGQRCCGCRACPARRSTSSRHRRARRRPHRTGRSRRGSASARSTLP